MAKKVKKTYVFGNGQKKCTLNLSKDCFEPVSAHSDEYWKKRAERNEKKAAAAFAKFAAKATPAQQKAFWDQFKEIAEQHLEEVFREEGLI